MTFLLCLIAAAQTVPAKLEFDAASVKPSAEHLPGTMTRVGCSGGPGTKDPGLFTCENMSLMNLVTLSWKIDSYRLAGLEWDRQMFDVTARLPEGTTKDQFSVMLQNLMTDRFHAAVHHEMREMTQYDLVVAKNGPKFKKAAEALPENPDAPPPPPGANRPATDKAGYPVLAPGRPGMAINMDRARLYQPRMTMDRLAVQVSAQIGKPVTNATALAGEYEIALFWASDRLSAAKPDAPDAPDPGPTLMQALQEQLGLRLEQKKGPVDFLVVDHIDKMPSSN